MFSSSPASRPSLSLSHPAFCLPTIIIHNISPFFQHNSDPQFISFFFHPSIWLPALLLLPPRPLSSRLFPSNGYHPIIWPFFHQNSDPPFLSSFHPAVYLRAVLIPPFDFQRLSSRLFHPGPFPSSQLRSTISVLRNAGLLLSFIHRSFFVFFSSFHPLSSRLLPFNDYHPYYFFLYRHLHHNSDPHFSRPKRWPPSYFLSSIHLAFVLSSSRLCLSTIVIQKISSCTLPFHHKSISPFLWVRNAGVLLLSSIDRVNNSVVIHSPSNERQQRLTCLIQQLCLFIHSSAILVLHGNGGGQPACTVLVFLPFNDDGWSALLVDVT